MWASNLDLIRDEFCCHTRRAQRTFALRSRIWPNGIQNLFPAACPLYKNGVLVGGIGIKWADGGGPG